MPFEIFDSISSCGRSIFRFRQDNRPCSLGSSIVPIDVLNIDENAINDPWESGP
jgi:hypothetical protein